MYVGFLTKHISCFIVFLFFIVEYGAINKLWRRSAVSFEHVSLWVLFFESSLNRIPIKYMGSIKKVIE